MRKIPRGKGYDKASMGKLLVQYHQANLQESGNAFARKNKLIPDFFERSIAKHFPTNKSISFLYNTCEYCSSRFAYSVKTQRFCSPKCAADKKRDLEYFAGNRRSTVGLAEGVCQICYTAPIKGLASHHTIGKAKDPKGKQLIALCPGCHKLVGMLGIRNFVDDVTVWERLIEFSILRKKGGLKSTVTVRVKIDENL